MNQDPDSNHMSNAPHSRRDIVIALGDQAVPESPGRSQEIQLPARVDNNAGGSGSSSNTMSNSSEDMYTNSTVNNTSVQDQQPSRPLLSVRQRDSFQPGEPSLLLSSFNTPSRTHSITGASPGDSSSMRSERLPGHQQSSMPYTSALRNDYPSITMNLRDADGHPGSYQQSQHHRHYLRLQDQDESGINVMAIDYEGLDACLDEASLANESEFDEQTTIPPPLINNIVSQSPDHDDGGKLERAVSTGSASSLGGVFRRRSVRKSGFYSERAPRPPLPEQSRYMFFSKTTGMIQAPSLPAILKKASLQGEPGTEGPKVFSDLLKDGCFWIDILDPSDFDMQVLSKFFHVHPLTIEDISTEEVREKYEVFRNYYFVCFRTFDQDYNSGTYLQPASMYSVVLRDGIITFHFRPTDHHFNVLRRVEQFHSHITLTPDWINYALLDDITDSFASPIQTIEYEVDSIDELVLLLRENETSDMLRRIGSCRKNVMAISRLLTNKADVIRGLMKRFDERYFIAAGGAWSNAVTGAGVAVGAGAGAAMGLGPGLRDTTRDSIIGGAGATLGSAAAGGGTPFTRASALPNMAPPPQASTIQSYRDGEILLHLGDILDHVLTMLQSLYSYEKILGRSHSNYLAQISLEINQLSNKTNSVVGTLTFFASLIVPMTFVAGLWGMNVHVPGQPGYEGEPLHWWWGLLGFMGLYCIAAVFFGKRYGLI